MTTKKFMCLPDEYCSKEKSKVIIIPINYEGNRSVGSGTIDSYKYIIDASRELEYFDIDTKKEGYQNGIYIYKEINSNKKDYIKAIDDIIEKIPLEDLKSKFPIFIGGDHSISKASVKCLENIEHSFGIIVFDAHLDLREDLGKESWNHACVTREISKDHKTVLLGIRSSSLEEYNFFKKNIAHSNNINYIKAEEIINNNYNLKKELKKLPKKIFISFDVDVFDPSIIKNTNTPEPGGLDWYKVNDLLKQIFSKKEVIGVDLVEYSPFENKQMCFSESFTLAKLIYKIINYKF